MKEYVVLLLSAIVGVAVPYAAAAESISAALSFCPQSNKVDALCTANHETIDAFNFVAGNCEIFKEGFPTGAVDSYNDGDPTDPIGVMFTETPQSKNIQTSKTPIENGKEYCATTAATVFYDFVIAPATGYVIKDPFTAQNSTPPEVEQCDTLPPPPSNITTSWAFGYCHTCDCTEWEVGHSATDATSYAVEHSVASNGPWTVYSTTAWGTSYPHNGTNGRWFRVKASNAAGSIYSSPIWKTGGWCSCGGGGEEP